MTDDSVVDAFRKAIKDIEEREVKRRKKLQEHQNSPEYKLEGAFLSFIYPDTVLGKAFQTAEDSKFLGDVKRVLNTIFWSGEEYFLGHATYDKIAFGRARIQELRSFYNDVLEESEGVQYAVACMLPEWVGSYESMLPTAREIVSPKEVAE